MGFIIKGVKSVVKAVVGITSKVIGGIFGFATGGGNKKTKKATGGENLNKTLEPEAYRKIVFGRIAAPLDVRFWQVWGNRGQNFDEVIALASHRINAVLELYFEDKVGISASNSASGSYVGSVTRAFVLGTVGQAPLLVGTGTQYDSGSTFDGCAAMALKWLPDEKKLPDGIPNRYTQIVEGGLVYDPRRDSTRGGSGTHRANDRSTWQYSPLDANGQPIGRNNALQTLWYLLGWYIPVKDAAGVVTGDMLVCGRGVDPQDINMATFIAGANNCEVAGYYTDMVLSTEDDHVSNENKITADGLIGRIIDPGGLWSYYANVNDTANIAVELTDKDVLEAGSLNWDEFKGMSEQYNQVGGKFVNPSTITLFQPFPYPMVRDAAYETALGVKRRKTQDFPQVLDNVLAQRLARLFLNQGQYQGELQANFMSRAIRAQAWSVVRYSSERFGWTKLFRVWRHEISTEGGVGMLLKEIHASIWSAGTVTPPEAPGLAVPYNGLQEIAATGVTVALVPMVAPDGTKTDGFALTWAVPSVNVRRSEMRYRLVNTTTWFYAGPVERDITAITVGPLLSGAIYETAVRHISVNEIAGPWVVPTTAPANASGQFSMGTTGNVNLAAIQAAGGTSIWADITGPGKPSDNAGTSVSLFDATGGRFTINGNAVKYLGGNSWEGNFYSNDIYTNGAFVSAKITVNGLIGLSYNYVSPATTSYSNINFCIRLYLNTWTIYENGVDIISGVWNNSDRVAVVYDNTKVTYYVGPSIVREVGAGSGRSFHAAGALADAATMFTDIQFGPYTDNNWASVGGVGKPQNNADVTLENIADSFVGRGDLASFNNLPVSKLLVKGYDSIIPDNGYFDPIWWSFGANDVTFEAMDSGWLINRAIRFNNTGNFDFSSQFFNIEFDATYEIIVRIWNNNTVAGWSGAFMPLLHMPGVAWFSLKHGLDIVNPDAAPNASNAIVANGDTGDLRWNFKVTSRTMRQIQFRFKSTARGSHTIFQAQIRKLTNMGNVVGRISDPEVYNPQAIVGPDNTTNVQLNYTINATDVTVSIPEHTRVVASKLGPRTLTYAAISFVQPFDTAFHVWVDDAFMAGYPVAPVPVNISNTSNTLLFPFRYHIGSGRTPSSAGTGGSTNTGGGVEPRRLYDGTNIP